MIVKPEDIKLFHDVVSGAKRLMANVMRYDPPKQRIVVRDVSVGHTLDLHGLTTQQAYDETNKFLYQAKEAGYKHVTVITGLSGQIRYEFEDWMTQNALVRETKSLNGGGAYKVIFIKKKK